MSACAAKSRVPVWPCPAAGGGCREAGSELGPGNFIRRLPANADGQVDSIFEPFPALTAPDVAQKILDLRLEVRCDNLCRAAKICHELSI